MAVKIRLARRGRKKKPYYHIVVADVRAPRDGRFIEKLGIYNPMTKPATIELDRELALQWLMNGAQPTDTARAILRYKGVLYKKHLLRGVKKGALSQEQADSMFEEWLLKKDSQIAKKVAKSKADERSFHEKVFGIIQKPKTAPAEDSSGDVAEQTAEIPAEEKVAAAETVEKKEDVVAKAPATTDAGASQADEVKEQDSQEPETAVEASKEVAESAQEKIEEVAETGKDVVEDSAEAVEVVTEAVAKPVETVTEAVKEAVESTSEAIKDAVAEVEEKVQENTEEAVETVAEAVEEKTEVESESEEKGAQAVQEAAQEEE